MVSKQHAPRPSAPESAPAPMTITPPVPVRSNPAPALISAPPAVRLTDSIPYPAASIGMPLADPTRTRLEGSMGVNLASVRVHSDSGAARAADSMSARAFAYGSHVYLGSGSSPSDLGLMAHEVAHVVQQQGRPTLQMYSMSGAFDAYEHEAHSVSAAVLRGESVTVSQRTGSPRVQGSWLSDIGSAIGRGVRAVGGAIAAGASALANAAYNFIRDRARTIPGYDLLAFILGRDPITQQPVERNATNLIRGVLGLIPGGNQMWENIQRAGVIQRLFTFLQEEVAKLGLTWDLIRGLFMRAWNSVSLTQAIANPGGVFATLRDIFAPTLTRLVNFARAVGGKILEFIFEGALALGGGAAQRVLGIFRRIGAVFNLIVSDPVRFVGNLIQAAIGGFRQFSANILNHLRNALFAWLFGALSGAGLQLPQRWDFMGIISVVLQILGLTYARMRERFVRLIGEPAVRAIETAFEFLRIIVTQGLAAAWEKLLEFATGMVDTVIDGIKSWVVTSIVRAAVTRLATMFNPAGAIIQAIIAVYNTVMFFIERAQQIAAMVESYLTSIENIARGNISGAKNTVEQAMARTLPVIIGFLARLIGLGNISGTIRDIIRRIQATVDRAIDRIIAWVRQRAAGIIARLSGRGAAGADARTPEQKMTDLRAAVGQAQPVAQDPRRSQRQKTRTLNEIKRRYRLNALDIITDRRTGSTATVHVHGVINPTYDGDGFITDNFPPEPIVVIDTTIGDTAPQRQQTEEVIETRPGFQRAHLLGRIFGRETPLGVMLVPTDVNQELQARGIEAFIQGLHRRRYPGVVFSIRATAIPHPGSDPPRARQISYELFGQRGDSPREKILEIHIHITDSTTAPESRIRAGEIDAEAINSYSAFLREYMQRRRSRRRVERA